MTQERFFQITEDPDLLRRITYEELKTLALAYPYAHNLRCLLAIKARQIDHPEVTKTLATAAAYSLDRTRLFLLASPQVLIPQQVLAPEEVLQLKPLETVKRELEALAPVARERAVEAVVEKVERVEKVEHVVELGHEEFEDEHVEKVEERVSFSDWMEHFHPPVLDISAPKQSENKVRFWDSEKNVEQKENSTTPESNKKTGIAQQLAERSVSENQDVVSETLAKLYAKQGYRDKAAQMYARLALLFPEKSTYFAAEIEKLKK